MDLARPPPSYRSCSRGRAAHGRAAALGLRTYGDSCVAHYDCLCVPCRLGGIRYARLEDKQQTPSSTNISKHRSATLGRRATVKALPQGKPGPERGCLSQRAPADTCCSRRCRTCFMHAPGRGEPRRGAAQPRGKGNCEGDSGGAHKRRTQASARPGFRRRVDLSQQSHVECRRSTWPVAAS